MTKLSDYARPEWAAPRKETWYEHLLPQRATDAINQSPIVSALSRYLSSPTPQLSLDPDKDWLMQQAKGASWFDRAHPSVQSGFNTLGVLANFVGPGVTRMPTVRMYHGTTPEGLAGINKSGHIEGPAFLSDRKAQAATYGDHVVEVNVPIEKLMIDADLPGGRLLTPAEANGYFQNDGWSINDYLRAGRFSFGVPEPVKIGD